MKFQPYLMESSSEIRRLEMKTDFESLKQQALWAGLKEGMKVLDIGCGSGITSSYLAEITGEEGSVTGIDASDERIAHAEREYGKSNLHFIRQDIYEPMDYTDKFDFIWVRFFLEYHRSRSADIVRKLKELLAPGGIMCLVDLDHNAMNHYEMPEKLEKALWGMMQKLQTEKDFDPYAGRKLYSYLFDLGFDDIDVKLEPHHLIFGEAGETDLYNWTQKILIAGKNSEYEFSEYPDGWDGFFKEFGRFFSDPRRFTYTPLITCRGVKP